MDIVTTYTCQCTPGKMYASRAAMYAHKKTKKHQAWEHKSKDQKIENTRRDNEIFMLNNKLKDRDEQIEKLILEKNELKKDTRESVDYKQTINEMFKIIKQLKDENIFLKKQIQIFKKNV